MDSKTDVTASMQDKKIAEKKKTKNLTGIMLTTMIFFSVSALAMIMM